MELWTSGINIIQVILTGIGGGCLVFGIIQYLEGNRTDNAAHKSTGVNAAVSGCGIVLVAQTLLPILGNMLTI